MESERIATKLDQKGIKATANRILVYEMLARSKRPLSLADMNERMWHLDKSSISRVLSLFAKHDVVHSFEDGRGILNYELCGSEGECEHEDGHVHFYCERCRHSFCLHDASLLSLEIPEGFELHSVSFVMKGICAKCRAK